MDWGSFLAGGATFGIFFLIMGSLLHREPNSTGMILIPKDLVPRGNKYASVTVVIESFDEDEGGDSSMFTEIPPGVEYRN